MNLAGREQDVYSLLSSCIGFFPTAPVGVNSYYPWGLGRFLQEDAIEGSASLLASQNRYVYCQNDPVSLIDPTGYSPENTGTPSRFGQGNPANYSSSQHACIVSPWDGFDAKSGYFDGELAGKSLPGLSMPGWDGCYEVIELGEDDDGNTWYSVTINGETVLVREDENGILKAMLVDPNNASLAQIAIVAGLNAAFNEISNENLWGTIGDAKKILNDIVSFAKKNMGTFASILSSSGNTANTYFQFMKHAAIGAVIARNMQKYNDSSMNKYDIYFGFWTSFWAERAGLNINIRPSHGGNITDDTPMSLVDIANIAKAIGFQESDLGEGPGTHTGTHRGIMQVSPDSHVKDKSSPNYGAGNWDFNCPRWVEKYGKGLNFIEGEKAMEDAFNNIGIGVGMLYAKLLRKKTGYNYTGEGRRSAPTFGEMKMAIRFYYGDFLRDDPGDPTPDQYVNSVVSIFLNGVWIGKTGKTRRVWGP